MPAIDQLFQSALSSPPAICGHYFASAPLLHSGFSATQDDRDWFKELHTSQSVLFHLYKNDNDFSQTFLQCWHSVKTKC